MRIKYSADVDVVNIQLVDPPFDYLEGRETDDPDVILHFDTRNRLLEIEVMHASTRLDLDELPLDLGVTVLPKEARGAV